MIGSSLNSAPFNTGIKNQLPLLTKQKQLAFSATPAQLVGVQLQRQLDGKISFCVDSHLVLIAMAEKLFEAGNQLEPGEVLGLERGAQPPKATVFDKFIRQRDRNLGSRVKEKDGKKFVTGGNPNVSLGQKLITLAENHNKEVIKLEKAQEKARELNANTLPESERASFLAQQAEKDLAKREENGYTLIERTDVLEAPKPGEPRSVKEFLDYLQDHGRLRTEGIEVLQPGHRAASPQQLLEALGKKEILSQSVNALLARGAWRDDPRIALICRGPGGI